VRSDLDVPSELDEFQTVVKNHDDELVLDRAFVLGEGPGYVSLPADFGVFPRDDDASRRVTVQIGALRSAEHLFSNRAVTGFVEAKRVRLDMFLARRCLTLTCSESETCRREGCVSPEVDPATLPTTERSVQSWPLLGAGPGATHAREIALDAQGNVYAIGTYAGRVDFGDGPLVGSATTGYLVSTTPDGALRWVHPFTPATLSDPDSVKVAEDGGVTVCGYFRGAIEVGGTIASTADRQGAFLATFSPAGSGQLRRTFATTDVTAAPGNTQCQALAVAADGRVAIGGQVGGTINFGGSTLTATGDEIFIAVFDASFGHIWSLVGGGSGPDYLRDAEFDAAGNLYVVGTVGPGAVVAGQTLSGVGGVDAFVAKFDAAGTMIQHQVFGSPGEDSAPRLALSAGRVAVVGTVDGPLQLPGMVPFGELGGRDGYLAIFDADLTPIDARLIGGSGDDAVHAVAAGIVSEWMIVGNFSGAVELGARSFTAPAGKGGAVLGLDAALAPAWVALVGSDLDHKTDLHLAGAGPAVLVAGGYANASSLLGTAVPAPEGTDAFVHTFLPSR
jgi:hypothetical protein